MVTSVFGTKFETKSLQRKSFTILNEPNQELYCRFKASLDCRVVIIDIKFKTN